MSFIDSIHCKSRAHCFSCRTKSKWREFLGAPEICPFGITVNTSKNRPELTKVEDKPKQEEPIVLPTKEDEEYKNLIISLQDFAKDWDGDIETAKGFLMALKEHLPTTHRNKWAEFLRFNPPSYFSKEVFTKWTLSIPV